MNWEVLLPDQQEALRQLRGQGLLQLQHNDWLTDSSWNRTDGFTEWEDIAILPIGGNIGLVDRRDAEGISSHNCRLVIPTAGDDSLSGMKQDQVVVPLELIATQDIQTGDLLRLNVPYSVNQQHGAVGAVEVAIFQKELKAMGRLPPEHTRYGIQNTEKREEL
jgi:hypothetical protein